MTVEKFCKDIISVINTNEENELFYSYKNNYVVLSGVTRIVKINMNNKKFQIITNEDFETFLEFDLTDVDQITSEYTDEGLEYQVKFNDSGMFFINVGFAN